VSTLLSLGDVGKRHRRGELTRWILRDVSLEVGPREVVSVVAMRSQGKTTLLRLAAGILAPDEGRVLLGDTDLRGLADSEQSRLLREQIGWAGRGGPGMGVQMLDYVAMRLTIGRRHHRREVRTRALQALERVGMERCAGQHWEDLSDWDRALVEIAQAIVGRPRLLLVDDVIDGLGMGETEAVAGLLRELAEELDMGVLMSASDVEAALSSQRVYSLADGRLTLMSELFEEPPTNVIDFPERSGHPHVRGART
jgi:ABC-type branched-subunit amino acid transport system ATPase component